MSKEECQTSLVGKIPSRPDFVRINIVEPEAVEFATWLEQAAEACRRTHCDGKHPTVNFLFVPEQGKAALVGVVRPSNDTVGRSSPVAIFAPLTGARTSPTYPGVIRAASGFLIAAAKLLESSKTETQATVEARLKELSVPTGADLAATQQSTKALLLDTRCGGHHDALFDRSVPEQHLYAYRTLAMACEQARSYRPGGKPGVTLDCPTLDDAQLVIWAEMIRRLLGNQRVAPSLFWVYGVPPPGYGSVTLKARATPARLLACLGAATPLAPAFMANADSDNPKLWPLKTTSTAAVEKAKAALSSEQRAVLARPDASLEAVIDAFT